MQKFTLDDFNREFSNEDACLEYLKNLRWPNGITCAKCQRVTKHHRVKKRLAFATFAARMSVRKLGLFSKIRARHCDIGFAQSS